MYDLDSISLNVAYNGFILNYCELVKNEDNMPHGCCDDGMQRIYKKEIFKFSEGNKALERMKGLMRTRIPKKMMEEKLDSEEYSEPDKGMKM